MTDPQTRRQADRARIISKARKMLHEIELDFNTTARWNQNVRKPHEAPIDPDPDGTMTRLRDRLKQMLDLENERDTRNAPIQLFMSEDELS
jgi:hypothetical protein